MYSIIQLASKQNTFKVHLMEVLMGKFIDLTGQKFSRWTVIEIAERNKHNQVMWKCRCDCGTIRDVTASSLKNGNSKSCGCLQRDSVSNKTASNFVDLTGKKFGRWTVLQRVENRRDQSYYLCECECGNTKEVYSGSLTSG